MMMNSVSSAPAKQTARPGDLYLKSHTRWLFIPQYQFTCRGPQLAQNRSATFFGRLFRCLFSAVSELAANPGLFSWPGLTDEFSKGGE